MTQLPADAYPVAVSASERRVTPDAVRVETTENALILWVGDTMIGTARDVEDTRLQACLNIAWHVSQAAERFGALVRAELDKRARDRVAEPALAAMRAVEHVGRPEPEQANPPSATPAAPTSATTEGR